MKHKLWTITFISLLLLLVGAVAIAVADGGKTTAVERPKLGISQGDSLVAERPTTPAAPSFTTIITVTSTGDPEPDSLLRTCTYDSGTFFSDTPCTLRRALVEASHRPPADRPILIAFDLSTGDANYDAATDTWTIILTDDYSSSAGGEAIVPNNITEPDGYITIDGDTQIGGRSGGPKIIINSENSFDILSQYNTVRNLAFNGGGGIFLNESSNIGGYNTVEGVWVGLRADGQEIVPTSNPDISLAGGGIDIKSDYNTVSDTIVTGSNIGIRIQGANNVIQYSTIGTRGDGTIPAARLTCVASNLYNPAQWYGGWGIQFLSGSNNQVLSNTVAGAHSPHSPTETYPPAISTAGDSNLFQGNVIGIDGAEAEVGTCGQAFHVTGNNIEIFNSTIYGAKSSFTEAQSEDPTQGAFYINDSSPLARKVTVRNNVVRDSTNMVIEFGPSIPESLRLFEPPRIVTISDTLVIGETEPGSDCPNCLIELYLDDLDGGQDALELLTIAVLDDVTGTARFTATLDSALPPNHGIRLTATTQDDYVIDDYLAGTTTKMSFAYGPDATLVRDLSPGWNLFSIDVTPTNPAIADVLDSLAGQYDVVLSFEGGPSGGGLTYDPGNPGSSDLTTVDVEHGYWINITAGTTQTLMLDYEPARNDTPLTLFPGWNLVSYLPDVSMVVTRALASIEGDYELVQSFDGTGQTYVPGFPDFSDLDEMEPGFAYWIKIKDTSPVVTLEYPGALTPLRPSTGDPSSMAEQGVAASGFFTPTTEWADFYGVATLSGYSAPSNARIVAYDPAGVVAGGFSVHTPPYYGFLHVYADDPRTTADEGADPGDDIRFTIDGRLASPSKSTPWTARGDVTEVNLEVEIPFTATDEWSDFWGTLTIDGEPAPAGTIVAAYDPDGIYIGDYVLTEPGEYGFLHAYGDDGTTPVSDEGAEMGDNLTFKAFLPLSELPIDLTLVSGTATWQGRGSRTEVNLTGTPIVPGAPTSMNITGPIIGETNVAYTFTIVVEPPDVTLPITYRVEYTDLAEPIEQSLSTRAVNLRNRTWTTTGTKVITVTAINAMGVATGTHTIAIVEIEPEGFTVGPAGGSRTFTDTFGLETTIDIPAGVLSETTTFTYTAQTDISHPASTGLSFAGHSFDLSASGPISGQITITIEYRDEDWMAASIEDESSLRLYYWDETISAWDDVANACGDPPPTYGPDTVANILAAPVCHLSEFGMFGTSSAGDGFKIYLPLALRNH